MESMSFFDFVIDTYEGAINGKAEEDVDDNDNEPTHTSNRRGRPPNARVPYQAEAQKPTRCRIFRTEGHETLPRIAGKWLPRSDEPDEANLHKASILLLLKPWRTVEGIKGSSFEETYNQFIGNANQKILTIIRNIQYYYEGADGAKARKEQLIQEAETVEFELRHAEADGADLDDELHEDDGEEGYHEMADPVITEDMIEAARKDKIDAREKHFGKHAINSALAAGIFTEKVRPEYTEKVASKADIEQCNLIKRWEKQLTQTTRAQIELTGMVDLTGEVDADVITGAASTNQTSHQQSTIPRIDVADASRRPILEKLNTAQRRAHDIIEEKLKHIVAGKHRRKMIKTKN